MSPTSTSIIFYKTYCPYCIKALQLLSEKNIPIQKIEVSNDDTYKEYIYYNYNIHTKTVPQIILNNKYIGGYDDLNKVLNKTCVLM